MAEDFTNKNKIRSGTFPNSRVKNPEQLNEHYCTFFGMVDSRESEFLN